MTSPGWAPPAVVVRAFAVAFLLLSTTAWASLTLAEFGAFTRARLWALSVPVVAAGIWFIWRAWPMSERASRVPRIHVLAVVVALAATGLLTYRPADYLVNGGDGTVYLNIASAIERRGGINVEEPLLRHLDLEAREAFFERDPLEPPLLGLFPGGIQIAEDGHHLRPNFFHLVSAAIAGVAALTGSPAAGLMALPLAGLITLTAVWLLAVRVSSPLAATTAVFLLSVNFAYLWFARFPASEGITAALITSGLWFTTSARLDRSVTAGFLAGAAFGLAAAARLEVLVLVCPLVIVYLVLVAARRRWTAADTALAAGFTVFTAQALAHALFVTTPYTTRILLRVFATNWWYGRTTLFVPAALVLTASVIWIIRRRAAAIRPTPVVRLLLALVLFAAVVRDFSQTGSGPASLLFTPVGILAMMAGAVWLALDDPEPHVLLIVALLLASAFAYVDTPRAGRWYPIAWRRYVPVVLPIGLLLVGHVTATLWRHRLAGRAAACLVVGFLAVHSARQSQVLAASAPMAGLRDQIAGLAAAVPPRTVLVVDPTLPSHLGLSLHFTFEQPVVAIRHRPGTAAALERLHRSLATTGWGLAVAIAPDADLPGRTRSDFVAFDLAPIATVPLSWTELDATGGVPTAFRTAVLNIELYAVHPRQPVSLPFTIDIGPGDLGWRGGGFHGIEVIGGASVRWTSDTARVLVPQLVHAGPLRLTLRLAAPRPAGVPAVHATVRIADGPALELPLLTGDLQEISFDLDRETAARLAEGATVLTLETTPFVPRDEGLGDDSRALGLLIDALRFDGR